MTDIAPASVLKLASMASKTGNDFIGIIMSSNAGTASRYEVFRPLGGDVLQQLNEEDIAFKPFSSLSEAQSAFAEMARNFEDHGRMITAEVWVFHAGECVHHKNYDE